MQLRFSLTGFRSSPHVITAMLIINDGEFKNTEKDIHLPKEPFAKWLKDSGKVPSTMSAYRYMEFNFELIFDLAEYIRDRVPLIQNV